LGLDIAELKHTVVYCFGRSFARTEDLITLVVVIDDLARIVVGDEYLTEGSAQASYGYSHLSFGKTVIGEGDGRLSLKGLGKDIVGSGANGCGGRGVVGSHFGVPLSFFLCIYIIAYNCYKVMVIL
jgi:hypothetical protein